MLFRYFFHGCSYGFTDSFTADITDEYISAILRLIPYPFAVDFTKQLNVVFTENCRLFRKFYGENLRVFNGKNCGFSAVFKQKFSQNSVFRAYVGRQDMRVRKSIRLERRRYTVLLWENPRSIQLKNLARMRLLP